MASTFLTAEWRKLIMAQYAVKPKLLMRYLPSGVQLDLFEGQCYVSLVGFLFDRVRIKGIAVPLHTRFEEVNLRFYVRRQETDGQWRRGVVFVREFVPRRAIAFIAKRFYEEPYLAIPTRHHIEAAGTELDVKYDWRVGGRWHSLSAKASAQPQDIAPGSKDEFITEHYWGYTKRGDGSTSAYEVVHPRWKVYPVREHKIAADFGLLYGASFAFLTDQWVDSVLLAEGSEVAVKSGARLPPVRAATLP